MVNERSALLLLDYQVALCEEGEYTRLPPLAAAVRERDVIAKASKVLAAAREAGVFVVHVRLGFDPSFELRTNRTPRWDAYPKDRAMLVGSPEGAFVSALAPLESEPIVTKGAVDSFIGTPLTELLLGNGIRHIALAGVATNLVVESTTRHAADSGFQVTVIEDMCASFAQAAHEFSVNTILPMFASVVSSDDYLASIK